MADLPNDKQTGQIPTTGGMFFVKYDLEPDATMSLRDVIIILKALQISFGADAFKQLPDQVKRQFVAVTRDGKRERWNRRMK